MSAEKDRELVSAVSSQAPMPAGAVFLSYASEHAAAAERIASALRAAGIEVWFDTSELRGGDAWDRQIRKQIHDCRLFIAAISAHTETRDEGYFRREWRLAVERTHDMAEGKAFLVPVVIDGTPERGAGSATQRAALPGDRAGAELPRLNINQSLQHPVRSCCATHPRMRHVCNALPTRFALLAPTAPLRLLQRPPKLLLERDLGETANAAIRATSNPATRMCRRARE